MKENEAAVDAARVIEVLELRGMRIAVAESLTGGLLTAELIRTAGASRVVNGGIVAYNTELKSSLLGVEPALLAEHGAVHPEVARQLATNVRYVLAVDGRRADVGIATTGVAGPDAVDGHPVGTVYLGLSMGEDAQVRNLALGGSREQVRRQTVAHAVGWISEALERGLAGNRE